MSGVGVSHPDGLNFSGSALTGYCRAAHRRRNPRGARRNSGARGALSLRRDGQATDPTDCEVAGELPYEWRPEKTPPILTTGLPDQHTWQPDLRHNERPWAGTGTDLPYLTIGPCATRVTTKAPPRRAAASVHQSGTHATSISSQPPGRIFQRPCRLGVMLRASQGRPRYAGRSTTSYCDRGLSVAPENAYYRTSE